MKAAPEIQDLLDFLNASPTAWHAVEQIQERLVAAGFRELQEKERWKIQPGGLYFVKRNGSSLCAFITPKQAPKKAAVAASHTDSPSFKIKPNAEFLKENMLMLGVEIYGGPLLTSWLNRDLGIAGRISFKKGRGALQHALVRLDKHPVVIPQLAIHLDRNVNDNGLTLQKQDHLAALAALNSTPDKKSGKTSYLETLIKEQVDFTQLLGYDLFLYPLEPARLVGFQQQMISSYRIDSLESVHAALTGFLKQTRPLKETLKMIVFWDHEEVGSHSTQGAGSPFLPHTLERICLAHKLDREDYLRLLRLSMCLSVDLSHALHPNHADKHEPRHQILMDRGIVLKTNAQQRYSSDSLTMAYVAELCEKEKIPYQKFVSRNDIPSGTTIGPIHANLTGMPTIDIGAPQLSMHSVRELMGCLDHLDMVKLLRAFLNA